MFVEKKGQISGMVDIGDVDVDFVNGGDRVLRQTFRGYCANPGWGGEQRQLIR